MYDLSGIASDLAVHDTDHPLHPDRLIAQLNWRYATKKFDPTRTIGRDDWAALEESLRLTPSSGGLQPWKFITVTDPAIRARLLPASFNQAQVTDASHLVVFAAKTSFSEADVDEHLNHVAHVQGASVASLAPFRNMLLGGIVRSKDEASRNAWARNQVYIALGSFLTSAALLGIDACPMEGFDHAQYDEILGLRAQGLASAVIAAAGFRSPADTYAGAPKVRFPRERVIARV
jgi:nitroreductase